MYTLMILKKSIQMYKNIFKKDNIYVYDQIPHMKRLVWKDKEQCLMNLIGHFVVFVYMLNHLDPF